MIESPVLFVVEDLQWVDPAALELLGEIVEVGFNDRVLTVFTARSDFETPWGSRAHQTQLALGPLRRSQVASILADLIGESIVTDSFVADVMKQTAGNPLAFEEFVSQFGMATALGRSASEDELAS